MQFTYEHGYVDSALDVDLQNWGIAMALPFAVAHKLAALWQHLTLPDVWVRLHLQSHVQLPQEPSVEKESLLGGVLQMEFVVLMVSTQRLKLTSYLKVLTIRLHLPILSLAHIFTTLTLIRHKNNLTFTMLACNKGMDCRQKFTHLFENVPHWCRPILYSYTDSGALAVAVLWIYMTLLWELLLWVDWFDRLQF